MKKTNFLAAMLMMVSTTTFAGGLLTNTNQNVAFLRNPCRDASIGIDGVYNNPGGLGFLSQGWHLSFNIQSAYQTRTIDTTNPLYKYNNENGSDTHRFKGEAQAPVIPSFQFAWVKDKFAISGGFAITGGGGKCTFDEGLGTFENVVAKLCGTINAGARQQQAQMGIPQANQFDIANYSADMYMKGKQYYYGMQLGFNYKITDNLSAYLGGRLILADCNYYGYIDNIKMNTTPTAQHALGMEAQPALGTFDPRLAALENGVHLDCDQSGWSFMTILGLDYKIEKWNFAAKYEFYGRMHLKNQSSFTPEYINSLKALNEDLGTTLREFEDGYKVSADVPSLLTLGVQYSILPNLRASVGYHHFFDKSTSQYNNRQENLKGETNEYLAGVEWDINKMVTASAGFQSTNYGFGENSEYLKDISFTTNSCSFGLGAEVRVSKNVTINAAYFKTFYKDYTNDHTADKGYKDVYARTNDVFGVGVDVSF